MPNCSWEIVVLSSSSFFGLRSVQLGCAISVAASYNICRSVGGGGKGRFGIKVAGGNQSRK